MEVQQDAGNGAFQHAVSLVGRERSRPTVGAPLPDEVRRVMEDRLGEDLPSVRVHADGQAAASAQALRAHAYTVGQEIVFGAGQYDPRSSRGQRLLAHELAHVAQNRHGTAAGPLRGVSDRADSSEREARDASARVAAGEKARVTSAPTAAVACFGLDDVEELGSEAWGGMRSGVTAAFDTARDVGSTAWGGVRSGVSSVLDTAGEIGAKGWGNYKRNINRGLDIYEGVGSTAWGAVRDYVPGAETIEDVGSQAWGGVRSGVSSVLDTAGEIGAKGWGNYTRNINRGLDIYEGVGSTGFGNVRQNVEGALDTAEAVGPPAWEAVKNPSSWTGPMAAEEW